MARWPAFGLTVARTRVHRDDWPGASESGTCQPEHRRHLLALFRKHMQSWSIRVLFDNTARRRRKREDVACLVLSNGIPTPRDWIGQHIRICLATVANSPPGAAQAGKNA